MMRYLAASFLFISSSLIHAGDWPGWRGADRTDLSTETGLLQQWPSSGPKQVWVNRQGGLGYAGFSVVNGTLFTLGARGSGEHLLGIDANTGKEKWSVHIGDILNNGWGDGPRSTPTVDGGMVYTMSGQGNLVCVQAASGREVWRKSMTSLGGKVPNWGYAESPLIDGKLVICTPGGKKGTIAALDKKSGKLIWQSKAFTDAAQYSSCIAVSHNGKRQIIQLVMKNVVGIDASNGEVLWKKDWAGRTAVIPTPIFDKGKVFVATGYGVGCMQLSIGPENGVSIDFINKNMKNHHGGVILKDDHYFGYSDGHGWVCLDRSGKIVWREKEKLGKGAIAYAENRFYCLDEKSGDVVLIGADKKGWKEYGRFTLSPQTTQRNPKGRIWVHPVISNGKLYLRDQELIHCYDIQR